MSNENLTQPLKPSSQQDQRAQLHQAAKLIHQEHFLDALALMDPLPHCNRRTFLKRLRCMEPVGTRQPFGC